MLKPIKSYFQSLAEEFADIRFAASSLAFSTLLSLIPFLIVVLAVFQSIGGLEEFYPKIESVMISSLKEATGSTVSQYVRGLLTKVKPSTVGITGGLFLLWASLGLIKNIDIAFHRMWKIKFRRPLHRRLMLYWILLVAVPVALALFAGLKSVNFINDISTTVQHQFLFSLWIALFLSILFKVIPDIEVGYISAIAPAILTSAALSVVQKSFLWISVKVFTQNKIYGSLASFPIFLVWLLVIWYVVLSGVSLSAFMQHKIFKKSAA
ncbi:MAG: YihY/virulence factor BrkB family protein [Bdellovibrio sp.]|nr:YihY/virulence factor BrkB family protein [Bdellovibrio sp.]